MLAINQDVKLGLGKPKISGKQSKKLRVDLLGAIQNCQELSRVVQNCPETLVQTNLVKALCGKLTYLSRDVVDAAEKKVWRSGCTINVVSFEIDVGIKLFWGLCSVNVDIIGNAMDV